MGTNEFPDVIKDLEIGRLSWNIWEGPKCNYMYMNKEGGKERFDTDRREKAHDPRGKNVVIQPETEDCWQPTEAQRSKNGFFPRPLEGMRPH